MIFRGLFWTCQQNRKKLLSEDTRRPHSTPRALHPAGAGGAGPSQGVGRAGFGGYMEEKRRKLEGMQAAERAPGGAMEGVRIHVNGFTEPPREDLRSLILSAGGGFEAYWSKRATHMVCSGFCEASRRRLGHDRRAVVRPEWVVDSVAAGKALPVRDYLLERDPPGAPGPRQQTFSKAPRAQSPGAGPGNGPGAQGSGPWGWGPSPGLVHEPGNL